MHDTVTRLGLSPVLSPDDLRAIALQVLELSAADTCQARVQHVATGTARVAQGRVRFNDVGDRIDLEIVTRFGQRNSVTLTVNQLDRASLRQAVAYLDRLAREQHGDPISLVTPIPPRTYGPNTSWKASTVSAFAKARHEVLPTLVNPLLNAKRTVAAFAGVFVRSKAYAEKTGLVVAGQDTDTELTVTGWSADGKGSGWAGQAERDWTRLNPEFVGSEALRITELAANPVALEPGRRTAILDRAAVAQLVYTIGGEFGIGLCSSPGGVLYNKTTGQPKLGEKVIDERLTISSDPNDPDGGYLPFNDQGYPLIAMPWVERGIFTHIAWPTYAAAPAGIAPANDPPESMRVSTSSSGGQMTVDEMIANCQEGVYVNRVGQISMLSAPGTGLLTGVTSGGCFLIKDGKITKSIKNLRFTASPWYMFNRVLAMGETKRAAFGYAPWHGGWPIAPTLVPPVMVSDFNFTAMADAV